MFSGRIGVRQTKSSRAGDVTNYGGRGPTKRAFLGGPGPCDIVFGHWAHHVAKSEQDQSRWFGSMLSTKSVQANERIFSDRNFIMDAVVRTYTGKGSKELFLLLEKHKADVEKLMRSVKGFESYTLARSSSSEGGLSLTVCQDKAGTEESVRLAKEWLSTNAANISFDAPKVSAGTIIVHAAKH
jgi:hypothetical protein